MIHLRIVLICHPRARGDPSSIQVSLRLRHMSSSRTRGSRFFSAPPRCAPCVRARLEQNPGFPINTGSPITNVGDDREESVRVRLEQNPGFPIENVGNDREESVRVRLEQNPGFPIENVGNDREESVRVRLEQNPGFPIENVGNDREESVRARLEQNPGFPINTGSPITNVGDDREEKTGMTEGAIEHCQRISEHIQFPRKRESRAVL